MFITFDWVLAPKKTRTY